MKDFGVVLADGWVCRIGVTVVIMVLLSGCCHMGAPLCYRRVYTTHNSHVIISEWGVDGTDSDGECVEVRIDAADGLARRCRFEVWGRVIDSWVADLDADGNPEIVVVSQSFGSGSYGELRVVTFAAKGLAVVTLPEKGESGIGYMGHDQFCQDGERRIIRTFPIYADKDPNCCPSGGIRTTVYEFKDKHLVPVRGGDGMEQGECPWEGRYLAFIALAT